MSKEQSLPVAENLPESRDDVIEHHVNREKESDQLLKNTILELEQIAGVSFDPEIHAVDKNGIPSTTSTGKFRKKRKKTQKSDSQSASNSLLRVKPLDHDQAENAMNDGSSGEHVNQSLGHDALARVLVDTITGTCCSLMGQEWLASDDEKVGLNQSTAAYLRAKDIDDLPPSAALLLCVSAYALPRFTMPKTRSKLELFKAWFKDKFFSGRRKLKKSDPVDAGVNSDKDKKDA